MNTDIAGVDEIHATHLIRMCHVAHTFYEYVVSHVLF